MSKILFLVLMLCVFFCTACSSEADKNNSDSSAPGSMSESNEKYCVTINDIETDQHNVIVRFSVGKSGRRSDFFFYTWHRGLNEYGWQDAVPKHAGRTGSS